MLQPHSPDNRALARECKDVKINRVYIGSCTGGKTEDFMAAAKVFLASVCIIFSYCISSMILYLKKAVFSIGGHGAATAEWCGGFFDNLHRKLVKGCLLWWHHGPQWRVYMVDIRLSAIFLPSAINSAEKRCWSWT